MDMAQKVYMEEKEEKENPQLRSKTEVSFTSQSPTASSVPVVVFEVPVLVQNQFRKRFKNFVEQNYLGKNKKHGVTIDKKWIEEVCEEALKAIAFKDPQALLNLMRYIATRLKIEGPTTGAFWSDKEVGESQAKKYLGQNGHVLSDSPLGRFGANMSLSPQGPGRNESLADYAVRNQAALKFWGALSALYAEGLRGDVHVWLPHGLTLNSIFWNDELPALHQLLHNKSITNLWFHILRQGVWSENLSLNDLFIVDLYTSDRDGPAYGHASMNGDRRVLGKDERQFEDISYLKLHKPISVHAVRKIIQKFRTNVEAKQKARHASGSKPGDF